MSLIKLLFSKLSKTLQRESTRGFLWILGSRTLRIFVQAAYFILLTRGLGVQEYGLFMGVLALMKLAFPFASWGGPQLLVKNVSRDRALFSAYWGNAFCLSLITGSVCILLSLLAAHFIFLDRVSLATVFWVAVAELLFARFFDLTLKSFLAIGQLHRNAQLGVINSLNNLLAALCLILLFDTPNALAWSFLYAASRLILAGIALGMVWPYLKGTRLELSLIRKELVEGFYFSVGLSSQTVYNDVDKTMLSRLATLEATGIYGAAYRLLDIAMTPIMTALVTAYARFFREGKGGIRNTLYM